MSCSIVWWIGCILVSRTRSSRTAVLLCVTRPTRSLICSRPVPETQTKVREVKRQLGQQPKAARASASPRRARTREDPTAAGESPQPLQARAPNRSRIDRHAHCRPPAVGRRHGRVRRHPRGDGRGAPDRGRPHTGRLGPPGARRRSTGVPAAARGAAMAAPPAAVAAQGGDLPCERGR